MLEERLEAVESAGRSSPLLDELRDELESAGGDENFRTLQRLLDELRGDTGDIKLLVRLSDELSSINRLLQFHTRTLSLIRKLQSGGYRLYSRKLDPKTGKRRNLGTFKTRAAAEKHEREVQYFKRH